LRVGVWVRLRALNATYRLLLTYQRLPTTAYLLLTTAYLLLTYCVPTTHDSPLVSIRSKRPTLPLTLTLTRWPQRSLTAAR